MKRKNYLIVMLLSSSYHNQELNSFFTLVFLISLYSIPTIASYLALHSSLFVPDALALHSSFFVPDGTVNYDRIITNNINPC